MIKTRILPTYRNKGKRKSVALKVNKHKRHYPLASTILWRIVPADVYNFGAGFGVEVKLGETTAPDGELITGFEVGSQLAVFRFEDFIPDISVVDFYLNYKATFEVTGPDFETIEYIISLHTPMYAVKQRTDFVFEVSNTNALPQPVEFSIYLGKWMKPEEITFEGVEFKTDQQFIGEVEILPLGQFHPPSTPEGEGHTSMKFKLL